MKRKHKLKKSQFFEKISQIFQSHENHQLSIPIIKWNQIAPPEKTLENYF